MDPKQFQYLASGLAEHGTSEPQFRTAVSRAYYAVYNVAINLLKEMDFTISGKFDTHVVMRRHFNNSGNTELKRAAEKIKDLKTKRQHADYELNRTDIEKQHNAKAHVKSAGRVIETLENQCYGENREQIIKNIKAWRKASKYD